MSDRFKFRVWDNAENKYNGFSFHLAMSGELDRLSADGDLLEADKNRFTIEQCTGLTDKTGKLVYEGDVLKAPASKLEYHIKWTRGRYVMKCGDSCHSYPISNTSAFEIIGNIHEMEIVYFQKVEAKKI